jgi:Chaperone of endosialidase
MVAGLWLMLGAGPGWAGPPDIVVSDAKGNTAGGTGALFSNTTGHDSTAFGLDALQHNTTGADNTAFGSQALQFNTTGVANAAVGEGALAKNTIGGGNTAVGQAALEGNTTGSNNAAVGEGALFSNTIGGLNTAVGQVALEGNTTGSNNAAVGEGALNRNTAGSQNTAVGVTALQNNTTGSNNIALGFTAGQSLTSGSNNIYLGAASPATESNTMRLGLNQTRTFIAGVAGSHLSGSQVVVSSSGQLGIIASSARYKHNIRAMGARSRGLFQLRPVIFRYKQDPQGVRQYGLIAEEVAKVYPELVTWRSDGAAESVQYHELIPMVLNELQRQQRELGELKAQNERLQAALVRQTAALAVRLGRLEGTHTAPLASR